MKKKCVVIFLALLAIFSFSQEKTADIVVLLDNSSSMLPYFSEINEKVLQGICENFVRLEDSFHLLTFTEKPYLEVSQKIRSQSDVEKIVARFSLLYPLGSYSNFIEALSYSRQYINSLNAYTQKVLVIISDGVFKPPMSSQYYGEEPQVLENAIQTALNALQGQGVLVYFIKAPFPENVMVKDFTGRLTTAKLHESEGDFILEGKSDAFNEELFYEYATNLQNNNGVVSADLDDNQAVKGDFIASAFQLPKISTKENLGKKNYQFRLPLYIENTSDTAIHLQLDRILLADTNILKSTSFISVKPGRTKKTSVQINLPKNLDEGEQILHAEFEFADKVRTNPQSLRFTLDLAQQSSFLAILGTTGFLLLKIFLIIIVIILIIIIILNVSRNLSLGAKTEEEKKQEPSHIQKDSVLGQIDPTKVSSTKLTLAEITNHVSQIQKTNNALLKKTEQEKISQTNDSLKNGQSRFIDTNKMTLPSLDKNKSQTEEARVLTDEEKNKQNRFRDSNKMTLPSFSGNESALKLPSIRSLKPQSKIKAANSKEKIPTKKDGTIILELTVEGQTKKIGSRNIHALSAGARKSIGGGLSVFSIFFIKVPANIAEIRYDGQSCSLALLKPKYFPEADSNIIEDCLNTPITIISDHGYITRIMFSEYESQTEKLNELLLSVIPEEDKKKYIKK